MKIVVTARSLIKLILEAVNCPDGIVKLREYVFGYYYNEDEYFFDQGMEDVFTVLSPYLELEEAKKDNLLSVRLSKLLYALKNIGIYKEAFLAALYYEEIIELTKKHRQRKIDDFTYRRKLCELAPVEFDVVSLLNVVKENEEKLREIS